MKYYLGIDLGGTNCRIAKVDENGQIVYMAKKAIDGMQGPDVVLPAIYELIREVPDYQDCTGIGFGVPGPVKTDEGIMTLSTNLKDFKGFPLKATVEKEIGIPTFIDNDANVAGLAEALIGAGKGYPIIYFVTVSTGIGGALVINGQVYAGAIGFAGEIGNLIVDPRYPNRGLGLNTGAMEAEAGGRSLTIQGKEIFGDDKINHAGDVFDLAKAGDERALELVHKMTDCLSSGFAGIAHITNPSVFVVGGGMLKSKDVWFDEFKEKFYAKVHTALRDTELIFAQLEEPGLVGAAMLPVSNGL